MESRVPIAAISTISPSDATRKARKRASKIFCHHSHLAQLVSRHQPTLVRKWLNKTRTQRLKLLSDQWPDMPSSHRPDHEAHLKDFATGNGPYVWPYINKEDLGDKKSFLLLLLSRAHNPPHLFADKDRDMLCYGVVRQRLKVEILPDHIMVLVGVTDSTKYGEVVDLTTLPEDTREQLRLRQFDVGEGLLILEAEEHLLRYLMVCCHSLLHDIQPEKLLSDSYPVLDALLHVPVIPTQLSENFSRSEARAQAQYTTPCTLDPQEFVSLLSARTSSAGDHLWSLRSDPRNFEQNLEDVKNHLTEHISDSHGKPNPKTRDMEHMWKGAARIMFQSSHKRYEDFSLLQRLAQSLQTSWDKHKAAISPNAELPEEVLRAVLILRDNLERAQVAYIGSLEPLVFASPTFRDRFMSKPEDHSDLRGPKVCLRPGQKLDAPVRGDQALWSLWLLTAGTRFNAQLSRSESPFVVQLERFLWKHPTEKKRLTPLLLRAIEDICTIDFLLFRFFRCETWARTFDFEFKRLGLRGGYNYEVVDSEWREAQHEVDDDCLNDLYSIARPAGEKLRYPLNAKRTKETVAALRREELRLDASWARIDNLFASRSKNSPDSATASMLKSGGPLRRTPVWEDLSTEAVVRSGASGSDHCDPLMSRLGIQDDATSTSSAIKAMAKGETNKVKTRGIAQPPPEPVDDPQPPAVEATPLTLAVESRSLEVFDVLFYDPNATARPGEIPWRDLINAMRDAQFTEDRGKGVLWKFRPTWPGSEGCHPVTLHQPHPIPELPYFAAREFGNDLNRAYGLTRDSFVLREKKEG